MDSKEILAVYDEELLALLKAVGLLDSIEAGAVFCSQCETQITLRNIQLIIPREKERFELVCNNAKCVESFYSRQGEQ